MKRYALIASGKVANVIESQTAPQDPAWREVSATVGPGDTFDGTNFKRPDTRRADLLAKLAALDAATVKPRTQRAVWLGDAATLQWLAEQEAEAVKLRADLAKL